MSIVAAYSGTFDPITFGHSDIIERASAMFPRVIVAVGLNPSKNPRFSIEERVELVRQSVASLKNVDVKPFSGLVVDRFGRARPISIVMLLSAACSLTIGWGLAWSFTALVALGLLYGVLVTAESAMVSTGRLPTKVPLPTWRQIWFSASSTASALRNSARVMPSCRDSASAP